jgi:hypothetical protein
VKRYEWEGGVEIIKIFDRHESNTKPIAVCRSTRVADLICDKLNANPYDELFES